MKPPSFKGFKELMWKAFSGDKEKLLLHAPVAGWILMGFANIAGFMLNPEIKTKEKKFLIPQEMVDGSLNIALYYTITTGFKKMAKALIAKDSTTLAKGVKDVNIPGPAMGLVTLAGFAGTVIASNIITPIVRNVFAADRQNKYLDSLREPPNIKMLNNKLSLQNLKMNNFMETTSLRSAYPPSGGMKI